VNIDATEIVGLVAAVLTTSGFLPQIVKTWKTKDVSSLSLPMYLVLTTGMILWLIYGILTNSLALMAANSVSSSLTVLIVFFILKYRK
jgi:MtN3 and saliva related transmembrane protein